MIASNAVQFAIGVCGTVVLARLLRPQDFGYLAMVATFTNFVATFRDFGIPLATVHKQQLTHEQVSGLFWVNSIASVAVAALVAVMAPVLAWFYGEPKLVGITLAMAGGLLIYSMSMVHAGLMRRRMSYAAVTLVEVAAMVVGVIVGVGSAVGGAGYWALVFQQVSIYLTQALGTWALCRWRPAPRHASATLRDPELRAMLHYGKNVTAARIVMYVARNVDSVAVGYFAGARVLGLYQKAYHWATLPFWQIYDPLLPVAVSSFSRLQSDPDRYRLYVRTTLLGLFSATLPGTALLFLTAQPLILLLLGNQWADSVPFFRILSVGAYFGCFGLVTRLLYLSEGRTSEYLKWATISAPATIIGVAAGLPWGAIGVAMGFSIGVIATSAPGVWYCLRRSPVQANDFVAAIWRPGIASLAAAGLFLAIKLTAPSMGSALAQLGVDAVLYLTLYTSCWLAMPHGREEASRMFSHLRLLIPS
jgi:PST family polysaccharide transporter